MVDDGQIRWRCRRGMKELDVLLDRYLASGYALLSESERRLFASLLSAKDPELFAWLCGRSEPGNGEFRTLVRRIRAAIHS